jgi:hypothetical protein
MLGQKVETKINSTPRPKIIKLNHQKSQILIGKIFTAQIQEITALKNI